MNLWRRLACQTTLMVLDISSTTARVALDLLKAPAILSNTNVKVCSWLRRPKTILETRKETTFLVLINKPISHTFFKYFSNHRKKSNRVIVFICTNISACLFSVYNKFLTSWIFRPEQKQLNLWIWVRRIWPIEEVVWLIKLIRL